MKVWVQKETALGTQRNGKSFLEPIFWALSPAIHTSESRKGIPWFQQGKQEQRPLVTLCVSRTYNLKVAGGCGRGDTNLSRAVGLTQICAFPTCLLIPLLYSQHGAPGHSGVVSVCGGERGDTTSRNSLSLSSLVLSWGRFGFVVLSWSV